MKAVILAAGKGKRLQSEQFSAPKVMRTVKGVPLLGYVTKALDFIPKEDTVIIVGYKKEMVKEAFDTGYRFAVQHEQLGTGHAAMSAAEELKDYDGPVLVCCGDMPMMKQESYKKIVEENAKNHDACTILTAVSKREMAFGRIVRDENGRFSRVVEDRDCTPEQKKIRELNVGLYVFDSKKLFECLKELRSDNSQNEYYLTDVPYIMMEKGYQVGTATIYDETEILGVNTPEDLAYCESLL